MRRNAGRHMPTRDGLLRWSIVLDDVMIGRLTDAAALIEWQAAEIERLRNELDSRMQQASDRVDDALAANIKQAESTMRMPIAEEQQRVANMSLLNID